MRFRVLGPLRVWDGESWTPIRAGQQRVLLAVLLAEAGRAVSTDRLIDEIWGERPPRSAVVTVQGYVRRLRLLLGDHSHDLLCTRGQGYELTVGGDEVDAGLFERLADAGSRALAGGNLDAAVASLSEALDLWSGPALDDVPTSPIVAAEATRLDQRRLAVLEDQLGALLELGRHAAVVDELRRAVDAHPLRERLRTQLMRALHRSGRRAEALQTYREGRQVTLAELDVEPGPELRELEHAIRTEDSRPPPVGCATVAIPAQLPADLAGFTGRGQHLARLDAGRDEPTNAMVLKVITGMAGVGKTALAVHWAHRVRHRFPDGQLYVNLRGYGPGAPLRPVDALALFLPALGMPAAQVPADEYAAAGRYRSLLADRRVLVLLDNANHPDQIRPLLPGGPGCLVLVTSRDRFDGAIARDGAVRLTLDVLAPAESVRLLDRLLGAERVRSEAHAAGELAALCGHLPLALRIAAANLSAQPDRAISDYVTQLAAGDPLTALAVQGDPPAGVRAAFDHSYAALPTAARGLFRLLGVVPGADVSAAAAAALAGVSPAQAADLLDRLAAAHLLEEHAHGRYTMHRLLRRYAAARTNAPERRAALDRLHDH